MPVAEPGFIFKYFDKAVLGLAVLVLLWAGYKAFDRATGVGDQVNLQGLPATIESIEEKYNEDQEVDPPTNFIPRAESALASYSPQELNLRRFVFWPPIPDRSYEELRVGVGRRVVLDFNAPITPDSLYVRRGRGVERPIDILAHPYQGDFSKVQIMTKPYPDSYSTISFTLVGREGKVPHVRPLLIDRTIDKKPYAPLNVALETGLNSVEITFEEAPEIEQEQVEVVHYEVFRKDWSSPLAEYVPVGRVSPSDMTDTLTWSDTGVTRGKQYTYKIRTVGANTFPEKGNLYTEPVWARMPPAYDVRLMDVYRASVTQAARATVQVMRLTNPESIAVERMEDLTAGDAIDPLIEQDDRTTRPMRGMRPDEMEEPEEDEEPAETARWDTGMVMLRCDAQVRRRTDGRVQYFAKRIIFVGPDGAIHERWEGEVPESTREIWSRVRETP